MAAEGSIWDWLIMIGCFAAAITVTGKLHNHMNFADPYTQYRIKNFFFRMVMPHFWIQNHRTDLDFDRWLLAALDRYGVGNIEDYTVEVNGHTIWTSNYPHASGRSYRGHNSGMCMPLTRVKLNRMRKAYQRGASYWAQQYNAMSPPQGTVVQLPTAKLVDNKLVVPTRTKRRTKITEKSFMKKMVKRFKKRA